MATQMKLHVAIALVLAGCQTTSKPTPPKEDVVLTSVAAPPPTATPPEPVGFAEVTIPGDLKAFKLTGVKAHRLAMAFIPGMCVHPVGYVQAFQHTAAERGDLVTVQGDTACLGEGDSQRRWTSDLVTMDARIMKAFDAAGLGAPQEIALIGYSQGAERIERLVAKYPEKYTRAVLIASPITPSAQVYKKAKAVVMMAGTNDGSKGTMAASATRFEKSGVRSTYIELIDARHGGMGVDPEKQMAKALDFLESRQSTTND